MIDITTDSQDSRAISARYAAVDHYEEAIRLYEELTHEQPQVANLWFDLGHCYAQIQRNAEALDALTRGLAIEPDDRTALLNATIVLQRLGRYDEARAMAQQALASYEAHLLTHADDGRAWAAKAHLLGERREYAQALASAAQAETLAVADAYRTHANILLHMGRNAPALEVIEQALAIMTPHDSFLLMSLWEQKSRALHLLQRDDEALAAIDYALSLPPPQTFHRIADLHAERATILAALGREDDALAASDTALALAPSDMTQMAMRATLLETLHRDEEVAAIYTRALAAQPNQAAPYVMWGAYLVRQDRHAEAVTAFGRANAIDPGSLRFWDWINWGHALAACKRNCELT